MSNYSVYLVRDPFEEDFFNEIDPHRLKLISKHIFEDGNEVGSESYDGDELLSRTVNKFNDQGFEVESAEFIAGEREPFLIVRREFNAMGLMTMISRSYGDEQPDVDRHVYDEKGRMLQSTIIDSNGEELTDYYTYLGDCPLPATHISNHEKQNAHEIRYVHTLYKGEYKVSEEYMTHKVDKYLSRVTKYYWNDEMPNNVFAQVFNSEGELLEEMREIEVGNTVKQSWHLNSFEDCEPYKFTLITNDSLNSISREEHFEKGIRIAISMWQNDKSGRLLRRYSGLHPNASLEIYKYEN